MIFIVLPNDLFIELLRRLKDLSFVTLKSVLFFVVNLESDEKERSTLLGLAFIGKLSS